MSGGNPKIVEAGKATRFSSENQPGNGGRKRGTRDKLSQDFWADLSAVYADHGKAAIEHVARNDQTAFFKAMASLQPKEVEIKSPEGELSDEQLEAAYQELLARIAAKQEQAKELH